MIPVYYFYLSQHVEDCINHLQDKQPFRFIIYHLDMQNRREEVLQIIRKINNTHVVQTIDRRHDEDMLIYLFSPIINNEVDVLNA